MWVEVPLSGCSSVLDSAGGLGSLEGTQDSHCLIDCPWRALLEALGQRSQVHPRAFLRVDISS